MSALLSGRRVVITGGANGIGAVVARRFAEMGARGVVLDLPAALSGDRPDGWHAVPVDVREEDSVRAALAESARAFDGVDAIVAAAGVVPSWQRPEDMDMDDFDRVLSINARGVACTVKHAAPLLGAGSTITAVASLNSWRGDPNITSYAASKHAVLGIVRSAALALGPGGIRVNAVAPGPIATDALRSRMASRQEGTGLPVDDALEQAARATSLGRIATAAEVAGTIAFLTSDLSSGVTGQMINVDGGIH
ncbi:SDR family oxidoreductase [Actinomadura sp. DC4]|uniref:SDR family NAD(P)-dependent oxidoreductase n=1 Tax=Actinomadura sp. DC4 TaxID=3055069 RepID=UPI0025B25DF2|nr:SDR family oxidoreductase [Actinomadura sp. DC4]MDN3359390.1 SDR family oxidoreductase [Actinomadura sp. DC4]